MLGVDNTIWAVLVAYFAGMLVIGWLARRASASQESYLMGDRRFGVWMMIMHAFGAGTNPGDAAGVVSKTCDKGASGIWVSWMWMFGTPFYWLIAPVIRRLRCLTMADYFEERFGKAASVLYVAVASVGMTVCLTSVLLATTRTVQGIMGKTDVVNHEAWFLAILLIMTFTFMIYGYWGGIVAAIRTDMIQGIMIILLSFLAIPFALAKPTVGGLSGIRDTLASFSEKNGGDFLSLFDSASFDPWSVALLCLNAPLVALALPHLVTVCGAGRTEWEGRMGFAGGNMLKRVCTIGWSILALAWLAHTIKTGVPLNRDAAFGDSIRFFLPTFLQGLMLACVMAAAMSSGDAFQVTVAGLFSQNIYRKFIRPEASDKQVLRVTKFYGIAMVLISLGLAIIMRDIVTAIMIYFQILALVGISVAIGLLWRRMNTSGMIGCTLAAIAIFFFTRYGWQECPSAAKIGLPILAGVVVGVIASLASAPPDPKQIERFFTKIYTPIGQEERLGLSLDEVVPKSHRLIEAGGLFIVKPTRQSWVGFVALMAICIACVVFMMVLMGL